MHESFSTRLAARLAAGFVPAVVGLDPRPRALPAAVAPGAPEPARIAAFYDEVLPLLTGAVPAVKPNIAFFEAHGAAGYAVYERVCARARELGLLVIGDVKRGDIGSTAMAYAAEHFRHADALTLHPYLGRDSIEPFLAACRDRGRGVFVLVRTSNPSAAEIQAAMTDRGTVSELVADAVAGWGAELVDETGYSAVGAVVGATYPREAIDLRRRMPHAWLLVPGVGAQGGRIADLAPLFDDRGLGALIAQSRGVLECFDPADPDWRDRIAAAVGAFRRELSTVCRRP